MSNQSDRNHHHHHEHSPIQQYQWLPNWVTARFHFLSHSHGHQDLITESAFQKNQEGIRTIWIALTILMVTALLQLVIVYFSRSVSLLADTAHNLGDGLNSIPLLIAFYLARRLPTRRYNYGFGRAEDVAGIFIVLSIAVSAVIIFTQSFQRLINPQPLNNLGWIAAAAILGFLGNEAVAILQIRVGKKINSVAMVADGQHARTDGLTSLAVLAAAGGSWLGYPIVDPIIGFLIGIVILFITWDAGKSIWYRLMDAVDPELVDNAEKVIVEIDNVIAIRRIRMRWVGHSLYMDITICVSPDLKTSDTHQISEQVRHALQHEFSNLTDIHVHVDPWVDEIYHDMTVGHDPLPTLMIEE